MSSLKPHEEFSPDSARAFCRKGIDNLFELFRATELDGPHTDIW